MDGCYCKSSGESANYYNFIGSYSSCPIVNFFLKWEKQIVAIVEPEPEKQDTKLKRVNNMQLNGGGGVSIFPDEHLVHAGILLSPAAATNTRVALHWAGLQSLMHLAVPLTESEHQCQ